MSRGATAELAAGGDSPPPRRVHPPRPAGFNRNFATAAQNRDRAVAVRARPFDPDRARRRCAARRMLARRLARAAELERALKLATILKPAKAAARELAGNRRRDTLKMAQAIRARYRSQAVVITDGDKRLRDRGGRDRACACRRSRSSRSTPPAPATPSWARCSPACDGACRGAAIGTPRQRGRRGMRASGWARFPAGFEVRDELLELLRRDLPPIRRCRSARHAAQAARTV